jgi:predicted esterase
MHRSLVYGLVILAGLPAAALAQRPEVLVVFKDGATIKGKLVQKTDLLVDPGTGQSFIIPANGSFLYLDDDIRRIYFSPNHVQEAIRSKPGETRKDMIQIVKQRPSNRPRVILPGWAFEKFTEWNERWERTIAVNTGTGRGHLDITQRIIQLTPWHTYIMTLDYNWDPQFRTKELGPDFVLKLLREYYQNHKDKKDMKEQDKRIEIAKFMQQAGWYGHALSELEALIKENSEAREAAEPMIKQLHALRSNFLADDIERTHRIGQHEEAQARIESLYRDRMADLAGEKQKLSVQDLKNKYEAGKEKLQQAQQYLKELPMRLDAVSRPFWAVAAATILEELTFDTVSRLDTFLPFAQQHLRELDEKRKPAQTTEEVLALAVSGWMQGTTLAEPDVKNATKLFHARLMLQEYLKTDGSVAREKLVASFSREHNVSPEVMARVIRLMPPITPPEEVTAREPMRFDIDAPESPGGSYLVQAPPGYSPYRPYPVLMILHTSREKADSMLLRMRELAAHHGYLLVAPLWAKEAKGLRPSYNYSAREHALVLDSLRDLRRRFNVDSDRVFLFGWEDGGTMAFDIGLAHPDQFAGVAPMNGSVAKYAETCWTNAQYLPFYVIEGDFNGSNLKGTRLLQKNWMTSHYPYLYVEYKGRASEWYAEELLSMMDWMNRKKRHHPARELGRYHTAGGQDEGFRTLRETDNKFYFLSTDSIDPRYLNDASTWQKFVRPASLQANIAIGNEGGVKEARIWNQINVRTTGVKQVTVWLAPNMIDFAKPVMVRVNGTQYGQARVYPPSLSTMLDEFYYSSDRQRLFFGKIPIKVGS